MKLNSLERKEIERVVREATILCYDKLLKRNFEIQEKRLSAEAKESALDETVESGARTIERFSAYLRKHLELELEGNEDLWLAN